MLLYVFCVSVYVFFFSLARHCTNIKNIVYYYSFDAFFLSNYFHLGFLYSLCISVFLFVVVVAIFSLRFNFFVHSLFSMNVCICRIRTQCVLWTQILFNPDFVFFILIIFFFKSSVCVMYSYLTVDWVALLRSEIKRKKQPKELKKKKKYKQMCSRLQL